MVCFYYGLMPDSNTTIRHNNVVLFLSDTAPHMKKAGDTRKILYPKLTHVTCLAHGLHRIAEQVHVQCAS